MSKKQEKKRLSVSVSAAVFIEDERGNLLLLRQAAKEKGRKWGPPAGGMESHEDPMMAALREVREEIGAEAVLTDLIGIYTADRGDKAAGIGFVFRGKITDGQIIIKRDEIMDWRFFSPGEIQELIAKSLIYKPEYNLPAIRDWAEKHSYPLEAIKPLTAAKPQ